MCNNQRACRRDVCYVLSALMEHKGGKVWKQDDYRLL